MNDEVNLVNSLQMCALHERLEHLSKNISLLKNGAKNEMQ